MSDNCSDTKSSIWLVYFALDNLHSTKDHNFSDCECETQIASFHLLLIFSQRNTTFISGLQAQNQVALTLKTYSKPSRRVKVRAQARKRSPQLFPARRSEILSRVLLRMSPRSTNKQPKTLQERAKQDFTPTLHATASTVHACGSRSKLASFDARGTSKKGFSSAILIAPKLRQLPEDRR